MKIRSAVLYLLQAWGRTDGTTLNGTVHRCTRAYGVKTGENNTAVTRHAQCSGRMVEARNWNNRKSQTGRRSTKMRFSEQEANLHLICLLEHRMLIKHCYALNVMHLNTNLFYLPLQLQAHRTTNI
jgi:hypothetical protein